MATTTSERTIQLKKHFMELHEKGWSIAKIAEHFSLSQRHIYNVLPEIAEENGVSKESLLAVPHKEHSTRSKTTKSSVNPYEIEKSFDKMISTGKDIINQITCILQEER